MGLSAGLDQLPAKRPGSVPFYVDDRDLIAVQVWTLITAAPMRVWARILDLQGIIQTFEWTFTPASASLLASYRAPLIAGYLLSVGVYATTGTPHRGDTWAVISLERIAVSGNRNAVALARGYITNADSLSWPANNFSYSIEGPGRITRDTTAAGGAGAEYTYIATGAIRVMLRGMLLTLTTSGVAATRRVHLQFQDNSGSIVADIPSQTTQTASLTYTYYFFPYGFTPTVVGTQVFVNIPPNLPIVANWKIKTATDLIDTGDQYSAPALWLETWIEL